MHTLLIVMRRLPLLTLSLLLLTLPSAARPAAADPLRIETGFLFLDTDPARSFGVDFGLFGQAFGFVGEGPQSRNYLEGLFCTTCSPVSIQPTFRLRFFPADVIDPSSNSSCPGCGYEGDFLFEIAAVPPAEAANQPFRMAGTLTAFPPGSSEGAIRHELIGSGRMSASTQSALFSFADEPAPIPEPSTLLLLGSGLVFAIRRNRRPGQRTS